MTSYVPMPVVLQKVMQDQTYSGGKFGEIKGMILGMIENYNYELTLLETTTNILRTDLHGQYDQEIKLLSQAYKPMATICQLCLRDFNVSTSAKGKEMILFQCQHVFHQSCLEGTVGFDEELSCVKCNKNSVIHTVGYRRSSSRTEPPVSPKRKGKKSEIPKVHLSEQQVAALNLLWDQANNGKYTVISAFNEPNRYSRNGSAIETRGNFDEKFALRLSPPVRKGNI